MAVVRGLRSRCGARQAGWALAEVMVAVVIAGVAVAFLAASVVNAVHQAAHVLQQARTIGAGTATDEVLSAWTWGPSLLSAQWSPGPVLEVEARLEGDAAEPLMVGLWVNGWFRGEWPLDDSGMHVFGDGSWDADEGAEAVLRVRVQGQAWGSPWRSLVPGSSGLIPLPPMNAGTGVASFLGDLSYITSVHLRCAGGEPIETSWTPTSYEETASGPRVFVSPLPGVAGVSFEMETQSWSSEGGRALDVYF